MRHSRIALLVALVGAMVGCDRKVNPGGPTATAISFSGGSLTLNTCAGLSGSFQSNRMRVTGLEPGAFRDFSLAGARLTMGFGDSRFRAEFLQPGAGPLIHQGFFTATGDQLTLALNAQVLLPGFRAGDQRFTCQLVADRLFLTSETVAFDFTGGGLFILSRFEAELLRL